MKILPVNNNQPYKNNTNFKGDFVNNIDLKHLVKNSTPEGMAEFEKILKKIKKVDDNIVFKFEENYYTGDYDVEEISGWTYSLYKQNKQEPNSKKLLFCNDSAEMGWNDYKFLLSKINDAVRGVYKNIFSTKDELQQQAEIKNRIEKLLVEE